MRALILAEQPVREGRRGERHIQGRGTKGPGHVVDMQAGIASQRDGEQALALLFVLFHLGPAGRGTACPDNTDDISQQTFATAARIGTNGEERHIALHGKATDQREDSCQGCAEVPGAR